MTNTTTQKKSWTPLGLAAATLAVLALALLLINYESTTSTTQANLTAPASDNNATATSDADDQMLISQVSQQNTDVAKAYQASLEEVNSYISDAQKAVTEDPEDSAAQEHLQDAYQQKAMLYEMATERSLQ